MNKKLISNDIEYIGKLLIETNFMIERTQHSNPQLQKKIFEDEQLRQNNQTMNAIQNIY